MLLKTRHAKRSLARQKLHLLIQCQVAQQSFNIYKI